MKLSKSIHGLAASLVAMGGAFLLGHSAIAQALYVGDAHNDTVEAIEVTSGAYVGAFAHSSINTEEYKITGPRGIIFVGDVCLVINQNVNLPTNGEVLKFDADSGAFISKLVPA